MAAAEVAEVKLRGEFSNLISDAEAIRLAEEWAADAEAGAAQEFVVTFRRGGDMPKEPDLERGELTELDGTFGDMAREVAGDGGTPEPCTVIRARSPAGAWAALARRCYRFRYVIRVTCGTALQGHGYGFMRCHQPDSEFCGVTIGKGFDLDYVIESLEEMVFPFAGRFQMNAVDSRVDAEPDYRPTKAARD